MSWAEIISAAQQTPLGVVALVVLVIGTLASSAMLNAPITWRFGIVAFMIIAASGVVSLVLLYTNPFSAVLNGSWVVTTQDNCKGTWNISGSFDCVLDCPPPNGHLFGHCEAVGGGNGVGIRYRRFNPDEFCTLWARLTDNNNFHGYFNCHIQENEKEWWGKR